MSSFAKEKLEAKFQEVYTQLNDRQREAVDTLEGPVMVIAGPGTGKTQILAARIGKILLDTDAQPENILCLTYTDAGTVAMRKRLVQFIGAAAYKVNIYTFHGFCNDVIQDNLSLFEKTSLDPVSDLEKIQILKELIDAFPKNHPLKRYRGDVYFDVKNLDSLFATMKKEGWTPAFINERIDAYLADLPNRDGFVAKRAVKEFKKGDLRTDKIEEEKNKLEKVRAAVNEFDHYQALLKKKNRYDFDDMINWVIDIFQTNPDLLRQYQELYQYILVDEYQDTSGTQNKIVELIISYWESPNVFVVGDDDQSIYRFQGANVENMLQFAHHYMKHLRTIVLTDNYRSTQPILDVSKTLIDHNQDRLVNKLDNLSKTLTASNPAMAAFTNPPVLQEYSTMQDEMIGITNQIKTLIQNGHKPGDIAVIYKENKYGTELSTYFRLNQIPFYTKRSINILDNIFVNKIISILRYLDAEHDIPYGGDGLLFEILHFDFYKVPPIEIAKLAVEANARQFNHEVSSLRKLLSEKIAARPKDLFDEGIHAALKRAGTIIEMLIGEVPNLTLQQLVSTAIGQGGVLEYVMQHDDKIVLHQLLNAFFDFVKEETARQPLMSLHDLIQTIDLMQKENIGIPLVEVTGNENGVNLLTAHGSKGLEFDHVFFVGANSKLWEKKKRVNMGFKMPDTMFSTMQEGDDDEEVRRLFYVALTRAKLHLHLSYAKFDNKGKELEPSQFITEIQEQHVLPVEQVVISEDDKAAHSILCFSTLAPEIQHAEDDLIDGLLSKFIMNVTALNNYLRCPLQFYYQNLIRIPSGKNEATEFGSAMHYALERLFRRMQDSGTETFPPKAVMTDDFKWYMNRHRELFTKESFARRMEYGQEVISNYYDKYIDSFNKIVAVERNIRGVVVNGVPLRGKLDKLEFEGRHINVVDYKTGDVEKAKKKLEGPGEKQPEGGDYWRQAVFYKILIDNYDQKDWQVVSTEFDFVEPDKDKNYQRKKIVISPEDTATVTQQITETWQKIQDKDFYTGCGKEDCHWCNFVKNNKLEIALHEIEEEE
ncbi:MAG: ATP-dependent DNA helicase [Niabella sp.]